MRNDRQNVIVDKSFQFSLSIIEFSEVLEASRKYVLGRQILKSGTSIGANIFEAQNAESKLDFIHKMKIAAKEADETQYWLLLCKSAKNYPDPNGLLDGLNEIIKLLSKILSTAKNNIKV